MIQPFDRGRLFILTHARLLERRLFQVRFEGASPDSVGQVIRAYQNPDGGLGHALEPDVRCTTSQPLFVEAGLLALAQAGCRDSDLATSVCDFLDAVSDDKGLVPAILKDARDFPLAGHWGHASVVPDMNVTIGICGLLHYQGVEHPWLTRATETCCEGVLKDPPREAHTLLGVARLADHLPDRSLGISLFDAIAQALPKAEWFIADAPVESYGLTPLDFAFEPTSVWRQLFSQEQINAHLEDLLNRQLPDGGWPIRWEAPGPVAALEWRGHLTLNAICRLNAYGVI